MPILISLALFALLMAGISAYGYRRYARPARILEQLGSPVIEGGTGAVSLDRRTEPYGAVGKALQQIGTYVPVSADDASSTKRRLIMAGYRSEYAMPMFFGIKVVAVVIFFVLVFLIRDYISPNPVFRIVLLLAACGAGFSLPAFFLEKRVVRRQETLRLSLPDALDLMVISVEAGLGLDQAIQHVGKELQLSHPEVSEELGLVTLEMRAGKRRADALKNLAERTGESELRKLVAILIQNDRFGTSMAESLRTHSDFMRTRRRQEAEERAGKVGVKLVFPIFFFILPSMLVVAAGPGLLQIFKYLFPMMKDFH